MSQEIQNTNRVSSTMPSASCKSNPCSVTRNRLSDAITKSDRPSPKLGSHEQSGLDEYEQKLASLRGEDNKILMNRHEKRIGSIRAKLGMRPELKRSDMVVIFRELAQEYELVGNIESAANFNELAEALEQIETYEIAGNKQGSA